MFLELKNKTEQNKQKTAYQNLYNTVKVILKCNVTAISAYIKKINQVKKPHFILNN